MCLRYKHSDIAREHRITSAYVWLLVNKACKNKKFIAELISERDRKEKERENIAGAIAEMNKKDIFIDSVSYIRKELKLGSKTPP